MASTEVTRLLRLWTEGDKQALERLIPILYDELRAMAGRHLSRERSDHTLQPTALVHEVYLRLADQERSDWKNRAHFFAIAAQMMRRVLVDHARRNQADKRIGASRKVAIEHAPELCEGPRVDVLELDEVLTRLTALDERQAKVVELRFFGGLTVGETAEVLGVSEATIAREWRMARAWLKQALERGGSGGP